MRPLLPTVRRTLPTAFLTSLLLLAPLASAQAPAAPDAPRGDASGQPFVDTVEVTLINVNVSVTDRSGNPVPGLEAKDFEVYEDGERVEVSNFAWVDRPHAGPEADGPDSVANLATTPTEGGEAAMEAIPVAAPVAPLHLVLYVDNNNILPSTRNRVLPELQRFLTDELAAQDQVMVVSFDRSLRVVQPFTTDRTLAIEALEGMMHSSTERMLVEAENQRLASELDHATDNTLDSALLDIEAGASAQRHTVASAQRAMSALVSALAGLPEPKAVVHVSDGMPLPDASAEGTLQNIIRSANANRVTFYALDSRGSRNDDFADSRVGSPDSARFVTGDTRRQDADALKILAADTGGFAVSNTSGFRGGLERIGRQLSGYYSLGYTPRQRDGEYHRIKVKAKGRGLQLRYRDGYQDRSTQQQMADSTLAVLSFDSSFGNPLGVELAAGPPQADAGGHPLVTVTVKLPLQQLTFIPQDTFRAGQVKLYVVAMDSEGHVTPMRELTVPIRIPEQQMASHPPEFVAYQVQVPFAQSGTTVAVGAQDQLGVLRSFTSLNIAPTGHG